MPQLQPNLLAIIFGIAAFSLVPFAVVTLTAFLKISVVLFLVRNALGTQQTPPNLVLYAIAIVLTIYVSAPLIATVYAKLSAPDLDISTAEGLRSAAQAIADPVRAFLERFAAPRERAFLLDAAKRIW